MARSAHRRFRRDLVVYALESAAWIGRRIPLRTGQYLGRILGKIAFRLLRRERDRALKNIALAFPQWDEGRRHEVIRRMFEHLGMSLFEICWLPNLNPDTLDSTTTVEGLEHLQAASEAGHGAVAFAAHCGNWEWLAAGVAALGYDINVIAREVYDSRLNEFIVSARKKNNVNTIGRGSTLSAKEILTTLRRGGILAFLIDQNIRADSAVINFFDHPALTPIGPAKLAIRSGARAFAAFEERRSGRHYIRIEPPIEIAEHDDPVRLTEYFTGRIEEQIRRAPEQWVWMHERWKKRTKVKIVR